MTSSRLLRTAVAYDPSRWSPLGGTRCVLGVAIAALGFLLTKHPGAAVLASLGALYTGLAVSSGVYHARIRAMVTSGCMIGSATTIGAALGHSPVASFVVVFTVALFTALYASTNRFASTIGAQTTAILCIVLGLGLPTKGAITDGLLVLTGSAAQLALLAFIWPIKPFVPERKAVARVFESLAKFVQDLDDREDRAGPRIPDATPFQEARSILEEAENHWRPEHDQLLSALRKAEALRAAMVGFANADAEFAAFSLESAIRSSRVHRSLSRAFLSIAARARDGRLEDSNVKLKLPMVSSKGAVPEAYSNWLELVVGLVQDCCGSETTWITSVPRSISKPAGLVSLFSRFTALPDIASLRSLAFQHAIRYAATVEVAFAISHYWRHSHSYWLPMTVALVLRQDYGSTFQRALARLLGTLVGLLLADVVIGLFHPLPVVLQVLTLAITWLAFAAVQASYAITTVAITCFVVFSVAVSGMGTTEISSIRFEASLLGIILALASYYLWPAWHWSQVWETLREACRSQIAYAETVLTLHLQEETSPNHLQSVDSARAKARALRVQSENLIRTVETHPQGRNRNQLQTARTASQEIEENAAILLAAEAGWNLKRGFSDDRLNAALSSTKALLSRLESAD